MKHQQILDKIVSEYTQILHDNLVGIYLHGSLAMDCSNRNSDIDFLVIVDNPLSKEQCRKLIDIILNLENVPTNGIEMSVVLKKHCHYFVYPTPFELHYSDYYKNMYKEDKSFICGGFEDKDLAAHFMITKHRGICLFGSPINKVFKGIPEDAYIKSIFCDISEAKSGISKDTVYHILNLCRTLAYVKDKKVLSKLEGGQWAIDKVDDRFKKIIKNALDEYLDNNRDLFFDKQLLTAFVDYMYMGINFTDN